MNGLQQELFEKQLASVTQGLKYPRTPNIAGAVMGRLNISTQTRFFTRRLAWSLVVTLVLFSSLMLIPPARAAILEFIEIGIVRIFRAEPTPMPASTQESSSTMTLITATPGTPSEALIPILEDLVGEMTLEEAQKRVEYPIVIPSYPRNLGEPDRVFVQEADGKMTILVWIDSQQPDEVAMSLHIIPPGSWAIDKMNPALIQETTVDGQPAVWAVGPYPLRLRTDDITFMRLINGRVLIWEEREITYRLETHLSLEEAIKIAESLEPIP